MVGGFAQSLSQHEPQSPDHHHQDYLLMSAQSKTNTDSPNGRRTKLDLAFGFLKLLMAVSTSSPMRSQSAVGTVPVAVPCMFCLLGLSPDGILCSWSALRQNLDRNHWLKG